MRAFFKFGTLVVVAAFLIVGTTSAVEVIVPSPFTSSAYDSWNDTFEGFSTIPNLEERAKIATLPKWGVLLGPGLLLEDSNAYVGGTEAEGMGSFRSFNLINNSAAGALPATYTLGGTFSAFDNDGLGLIFGYQDENNFFRISSHSSDSLETYYPKGIAVQKCVNGVYTPLVNDDTQDHPSDGTEFSLSVAVDGNSYEVFYNSASILTGTDADLSSRGGDYGVYSYGQSSTDWGTQVRDVTLSSTSMNHTHTFTDTGAVEWAEYTMYNTNGEVIDDYYTNPSDFRLDFRNNTISQNAANGRRPITANAPSADFISPAVVIVDEDSSTWTDYEVWARLSNDDNDGIGLLVHANDDSFYRISFSLGGGETNRPPNGMSIQKCTDSSSTTTAIWSLLFADFVDGDAEEALFNYTQGVPFDVKVTVEDDGANGLGITVQVIDDPDGAATEINYPTVYDNDTPITSGSVGFTSWTSGADSVYSGYGGNANAPLITEIGYTPVPVPEPSTIVLLLGAIGALLMIRRRK